jgi:hypothetical protein
MTAPDIFTNVHKGIRNALFESCVALGRAGAEGERLASARARLREVLGFVAHHGENEDVLLIPLLEGAAPRLASRIREAHGPIGAALTTLTARIDAASADELYHHTCEFTALYLQHMHEEEHALEPAIREALSKDELALFGRRAVERTAPDDQRRMIGWMLPAMTRADAEAFLAKIPAALAEELRPLAE